MHKITKLERDNLFRAFRRLNRLSEEAIRDGDDSLTKELSSEETAILLAIAVLDESKLVGEEE